MSKRNNTVGGRCATAVARACVSHTLSAHNMNDDSEHDPETTTSSPKRHDKIWFPDGNVVLQTDTHLFRVHKSVLSLQSSVFRGMFELAGV